MTVTMTTVGFGDLVAKDSFPLVLSIFLQLGGIVLYGYAMHQATILFSNLYNSTHDSHLQEMDDLEVWLLLREKFSENPCISEPVNKTKMYFKFVWKYQLDVIHNNFFLNLPESVRT